MNESKAVDIAQTRAAIDQAIASDDAPLALALLAGLESQPIDSALANFIVSRFEKLRGRSPLLPYRLAILRSFTIEPLLPILRALALLRGIDLQIRVGQFGAYAQEILNQDSWLGAFAPDATFLAIDARDATPALWNNFADLDGAAVDQEVARSAGEIRQLILAFRQNMPSHLVVHNLALPASPTQGVLDAQKARGQGAAFWRINEQIGAAAREVRNVYVLDYNALVSRRGHERFHDPAKWITVRLPIAAGEWAQLAREWMRFLCPLSGRTCKALAIDLDNTLWGGVIGEDGLASIQLDDSYPGAAFRALQRAILDLHRRGILLALCSKNNPQEALDAIATHPGMLLRKEHFAALRINWSDKATNLREIAAELNIGLDAIAFLDESSAEREWIRRQLPEVTVIDLPADPIGFAGALRQSPVFERLQLSPEDRQRGGQYSRQRDRAELREKSASLEDYHRALRMRAVVEPVTPQSLGRAAQLTQKTNQFNLTTRRYSEHQLSTMNAVPWHCYTLRASDRFGDNGIVGVAILRFSGEVAEIDTLLLSCRAIGRTLETAFLAALVERAKEAGATTLTGWFLPTAKNSPAESFYRSHGFTCAQNSEGGSRWELSLDRAEIRWPAWIESGHSS